MDHLPNSWGTTEEERRQVYPCDDLLPNADGIYFRAVTVHAPVNIVFRWLCQLRVAPYSYDWIDNRGRQSPQHLIDGLEDLQAGQDLMTIFDVASFEANRHLTGRIKQQGTPIRLFGDLAASYVVAAQDPATCRLIVKLRVDYPSGAFGSLMRVLLPWGDLVMMRRQLLNLKSLAERNC
ncbi:MAG TPA: hypothetical protein VMT89_01450 [Candidatus Acidoferrales bacterium]|nr:hypothetical protein [Candidatus Acidoferrales bacterium]